MNHASLTFERTLAVREHYANEVFNIGSVKTQIEAAANQGCRRLQIHQDQSYSLQEFKAAEALEVWLDSNGYRFVWQTVYVPKDLLYPNSGYEYEELEIRW